MTRESENNRVGADIGSICRKCGDVWHVVVAVVSGRIAQVECKQCGGRHRYRATGETSARRSASAATRAPGRAAKATGVRKIGSAVEADPSRPPRTYAPAESYAAGDRILHPNFGEGVVQGITGPRKVNVLFTDGPKVLIQGRAAKG